jgi:hypothetical protein
MRDKIGFEIPVHLEETWNDANKIGRELCVEVRKLYLMIEKRLAEHDPIFAEVTQSAVIDLKNAWRSLQLIIPYAVCPYDQGDPTMRQGCQACHSTGYLPKFRWDCVVPKEKKLAHLATVAGTNQ